jgi:hypothetical protein
MNSFLKKLKEPPSKSLFNINEQEIVLGTVVNESTCSL